MKNIVTKTGLCNIGQPQVKQLTGCETETTPNTGGRRPVRVDNLLERHCSGNPVTLVHQEPDFAVTFMRTVNGSLLALRREELRQACLSGKLCSHEKDKVLVAKVPHYSTDTVHEIVVMHERSAVIALSKNASAANSGTVEWFNAALESMRRLDKRHIRDKKLIYSFSPYAMMFLAYFHATTVLNLPYLPKIERCMRVIDCSMSFQNTAEPKGVILAIANEGQEFSNRSVFGSEGESD